MDPPAIDISTQLFFWSSFNISPKRIQNGPRTSRSPERWCSPRPLGFMRSCRLLSPLPLRDTMIIICNCLPKDPVVVGTSWARRRALRTIVANSRKAGVMAGGAGIPLGARALYLGNTLYRIHGTNQPSTIGQFGSTAGRSTPDYHVCGRRCLGFLRRPRFLEQLVVQKVAPSRGGGLGTPQNGLAELIRRLKSRISVFVFDRSA
jgi:hypothetical protein